MSDMYGAIRSNEFRVVDPAAFKVWHDGAVLFGSDVELWQEGDRFSFGGYEQYPSAYPRRPDPDGDGDNDEWDLQEFASEMRKHLAPGEFLQVVAGGNEKLRYVSFQVLIVDASRADFYSVGSDNDERRTFARSGEAVTT